MELVTGVIKFDFSGQHYLDTFEGSFKIPGAALNNAWCRIMAQLDREECRELESTSVAGLLARGRINGEREIEDISYLIDDRELPERPTKEELP